MKTLSSDTHPDVERFHIELLRKAPTSHKLQMVTSLVKTTRQLSYQAICERYPNDTPEERTQRFLILLYGDKLLAKRVTDLLKQRGKL